MLKPNHMYAARIRGVSPLDYLQLDAYTLGIETLRQQIEDNPMSTIADVAKQANVSLSTVSYVISGKRPISDATRRRVLEAVDELGYRPNHQGRALASGRSRTIALLYPSHDSVLSQMPMEFVTAAASQAELRGYALILSTTGTVDSMVFSPLQRGVVDGYLLMEVSISDPRIESLSRNGVPFALIGRRSDNQGLHLVDLDFEHAIELTIDHLTELGHRSLALVCRSVPDMPGYAPTVRMANRFTELVETRNLQGRSYICDPSRQAGADILHTIRANSQGTTAVICSNPELASGLLHAAAALDLGIPADLSIMGIISPRIAEFLTPPITAVDFPVDDMGRRGVDFLIDQLEGSAESPQQLILRSSVTVRASTGPAARRT